MATQYSPEILLHMFEAFYRVRKISSDTPEAIAERIIVASAFGAVTVDEFVEAGLGLASSCSIDGTGADPSGSRESEVPQ